MRSPIRSVIVSATLLLSVLPLASNAAYTTFARAETNLDQIRGNFVYPDFERESNTGASSYASANTTDQQQLELTPPYRRQAFGEASASAGVLKAVATASFFTDGWETNSFIEANSLAIFDDILTIERPGARQATVRFEYAVSGSLLGSFATASGQLVVDGLSGIFFENSTSLGAGAYTCGPNGGGASACFGVLELTLPTNTPISLHGRLSVFAGARGLSNEGNSSAQYGNTGLVYLSSPDSEVQLFTQSGFSYLAPVPEAQTWRLLLAGLLTLGVVARHRRNVT